MESARTTLAHPDSHRIVLSGALHCGSTAAGLGIMLASRFDHGLVVYLVVILTVGRPWRRVFCMLCNLLERNCICSVGQALLTYYLTVLPCGKEAMLFGTLAAHCRRTTFTFI